MTLKLKIFRREEGEFLDFKTKLKNRLLNLEKNVF